MHTYKPYYHFPREAWAALSETKTPPLTQTELEEIRGINENFFIRGRNCLYASN